MLNWDTIQYIFQIPLRWYRYIHNCCFKSYGGNLIQITDQGDGTKEISVPQEEFEAAVKSLAKVKTVDLVEPNDDGDVDFELEGEKWMKTDEDGHIATTDDTPITLDGSTGLMCSDGESVSYVQIGTGADDVAAGDHNHDDQYADVEHNHDARYSPLGHKHTVSEITDLDLNGFLTEDDVGDAAFMNVGTTDGTVASGSHSHDLADMKLIVPGHSGNCIVVMDNAGQLTHSGNTAYNLLNNAAATEGVSKLLTDKSFGTGKGTVAEGDHTHTSDDITDLDLKSVLYESDIGVYVADQNHTHDEYAAKTHSHDNYAAKTHTHSEYAAKAHTHTEYAPASHTHSNYAAKDHTHKLEDMTLNIQGHSGNCLVVMDNYGKLTHSGNDAYNLLNTAATTSGVTKLLTNKSFGKTAGTAAEGNHKHTASDITDLNLNGYLKTADIGVKVAAQSHTHSDYAAKSHTHSNYAAVDHTHSGYATTDTVSKLTDVVQHINDNYVTTAELQPIQTQAQQAYDAAMEAYSPSNPPYTSELPDWNDATSKFLDTTDVPTDFIAAIASGRTGSFTVVSDIQWTGTYLQKKTRSITVTKGLITNIGSESSWSTFETPVVISWS